MRATAWLGLSFSPAMPAADFFSIKDENPLLRGLYVPLPADPVSAPASINITGSIANTLNIERTSREELFVDGEAATLRLNAAAPLGTRGRARLVVPVIHDSGGVLDSTIDHWHRWFGLPQGSRPDHANNQLNYLYSGFGAARLDRSHTGVGDIAAELGFALRENAHSHWSVWSGVEAPTGRRSRLEGNDAWDSALWVAGGREWAHWNVASEIGWTHAYGDGIYAGRAQGNSGFARAAAGWNASRSWTVRAQLEGHTARLHGTDIRFLGPSLLLGAGVEWRGSAGWQVQTGFVEDIVRNTGPDFTFFLGMQHSR